ncbi:MAG TPA: ribose-5-phosphate isomerase RpiA [Thermoplasmata archaeon]|nr:ribose-5-phosphate isomerase RpiA [Thermoplasmata archaeon]
MADPDALSLEKDRAARAAVRRVRPGMRVVLGTGTTAAYAIRALAQRFSSGPGIEAVASSGMSETLAREHGLAVRSLAPDDRFDILIDGADEVTPHLDLTKGGGGALFREKYLARLADEVVIVVDHTKLVDRLGRRAPLPVEVVPFARPVVARQLGERRYGVRLRTAPDGAPFRTENGNEILDLTPPAPLDAPAAVESELRGVPGVVETGLFVGLVHRVFVGLPDDTVEELERPAAASSPAPSRAPAR